MCLYVKESHVREPIRETVCFKILRYEGYSEWVTPYQLSPVVAGTGWFMPLKPSRRRISEYRDSHEIEGGYIHAYTSATRGVWGGTVQRGVIDEMPTQGLLYGRNYRFKCIAREVVAVGFREDIVCRALYIPAFDLTGEHRNAILDLSAK